MFNTISDLKIAAVMDSGIYALTVSNRDIAEKYPGHSDWFVRRFCLCDRERYTPYAVGVKFLRLFTVGAALIRVDSSEKITKICTMYVRPWFRMKGVGSRLVSKAVSIAKNTGSKTVSFTIKRSDYPEWVKFCERHEFVLGDVIEEKDSLLFIKEV